MEIVVPEDPEAVARHAARVLADALRRAAAVHELATLALSGGQTPRRMYARLSGESVPWPKVQLFQTDERLAPRDHAASNGIAIRRALCERSPLPPDQPHWMLVACRERDVVTTGGTRAGGG